MALLPILKYPDPRLREFSKPVESFDPELAALAADMAETMIEAPGAGLAAPQVGRPLRLIVIDGAEEGEEYGKNIITLVNPEFISKEGEQVYDEGCLSVIDLQAQVHRSMTVEIKFQDIKGQQFVMTTSGRRAVILQHEIDHLDGVLFLDHLSKLKRDLYKRRLRKLQKEDCAVSI